MSLSAGSNTQPSFASLQRSPEAWAQYRKANVPQEGYDNLQGGSIEVSIVGYGREAQKVVKAAKDAIPEEVGDEEDVISLIQCLEDAIRIPSSEWALASQGVILQPDTFVSTHPVFQNDPAKLTLVPKTMLSRYLSTTTRTLWKTLSPDQTPSEAAEQAFHLIKPQDSESERDLNWNIYMAYRLLAENRIAHVMKRLSEPRREDEDEKVLEQIRNSIIGVLKDCSELTEFEQESIADGVSPFSFVAEVDELNLNDMRILSRIHSPTRPTAIDIYWEYHTRSHSSSVDFRCKFLYRVLDPMTFDNASVEGMEEMEPRVDKNGWKLLFDISLEDKPPGKYWYPVYKTKWGLSSKDADTIYTALFGSGGGEGEDEDDWPSYIDDVNAIRLLLAAAGIHLHVARSEDDELGDRQDRSATFTWNFEQEGWIAKNIRSACGEPLLKDMTFQDKTYSRPEYGDDGDEDDSGEDVPDSEEETDDDD